jgi:hypothetical protein
MGNRRFAGVVGVAWVTATVAGIILFSAAGAPPLFDDAAADARFTSGSATLFPIDAFTTGVSSALLIPFFTGLSWYFATPPLSDRSKRQ